MREIKFRAWDKETKKMLIVNSLTLDFHLCDLWDGRPEDEGLCRKWDEVEFMQYTGLLDKNGKEIYEGDVVIGRYEHYDPCADESIKDEKMGGVVFWDLYQWSFKVIEKFCDQDREGKCNYFNYHDEKDYWAPQVFEDMEIIGNIYESPELLNNPN